MTKEICMLLWYYLVLHKSIGQCDERFVVRCMLFKDHGSYGLLTHSSIMVWWSCTCVDLFDIHCLIMGQCKILIGWVNWCIKNSLIQIENLHLIGWRFCLPRGPNGLFYWSLYWADLVDNLWNKRRYCSIIFQRVARYIKVLLHGYIKVLLSHTRYCCSFVSKYCSSNCLLQSTAVF